jgi:hypothetical protein
MDEFLDGINRPVISGFDFGGRFGGSLRPMMEQRVCL